MNEKLENMEQSEIKKPDLKHFDINWDKVKTIKDIKVLLKLYAEKVVFDFNNENDLNVYNELKEYLK